ncbi:hypothetical protein D3C76_1542170 [compost metagenome]
MGAAELFQSFELRLFQKDALAAAAERLDRRTGPAGRKGVEGIGPLQLLLPVADFILQQIILEPLPLPAGVIGIVSGQHLQRRSLALQQGVIDLNQFLRNQA